MVNMKPHKIYVDYDLDKMGDGYIQDGEEIYCFCIATDQWHKCWMVLRHAQCETGEAYERIGMAWQSHADINDGNDWASVTSESVTVTIV